MTTNRMNDQITELSPVKQALFELRDLRARLNELERARQEPIAIIGMGCRFPGDANSPDAYWDLLINGVDAIREVPPDRWNIDELYDPDPDTPGKIITRWGGFLKEIDKFDPQFFGISPREAIGLDPQHRLLLEVSWEALENAGQAPDQLNGSATGVFIGISTNDYFHQLTSGDREAIDIYLATGTTHSAASGRISYLLGLQGPALSIDSACSSSLVAVHEAVQSLRSGECRMALAGGVNIILQPEILINFSRARMISPDGRCKAFDARADGFVRSEGCGMVVLKRLSDARAENDRILAVIRGSAVNQDGRSTGLTVPNGLSQQAVIESALANGGVHPAQVAYVETHGTGTSLGDPIEVQALAKVLSRGRPAESRLQIGSVKTNMGHLESAAGVAGLMKAVLVLQHREIPPHLHLQELNPYIPWESLPVDVPVNSIPLQPIDSRYLVGTSSFGFSGTNAHLILEAAPELVEKVAEDERPVHVLTLSAKQPTALQELASRYATYLSASSTNFADVCFTANAGRAHLDHRLAFVASSSSEAVQELRAFSAGETTDRLFSNQIYESMQPEVAFLFTGHGSHYLQMGRKLYDTQPTFRAVFEKCNELLQTYLDSSLIDILYKSGDAGRLDEMKYAQPALFAIEIALAQLWQSWGIKPTLVLGHSIGEYAAACFTGLFSLEDGLKLVATRGRLMDSLPQQGEMAAVFADEKTIAEQISRSGGRVSIAAINGPQNVVISGERSAVQEVTAALRAQRIRSQILAVTQAAHSPLLDPILDEFEAVAAEVSYQETKIGLVSALTGELASNLEVGNAAYWRRHLRQPVRFADAMQTMHTQGIELFVEIGPNPTLLAMGRRCFADQGGDQGVWLPSLRQGRDDWQQILESLAALYTQGVSVDWVGFDRDYSRRRVSLPTYPWQRERYWSDQIHASRLATKEIATPAELWPVLIEAGRQQETQGPLDLNLSSYPEKWQYLERLTTASIIRAFHELGIFQELGESHSAAELIKSSGFLQHYDLLIRRWLLCLRKEGYLRQEGESFVCNSPLGVDVLNVFSQPVPLALADIPLLVDYMKRSSERLLQVLRGTESPLEILFPGGSFQTAEFLYKEWPLVAYFNGLLRRLLQAVVQGFPRNRKLRILEVGAGSGGTTSVLLPGLHSETTEYIFTDISELFLSRAEEKFHEFPFIRYSQLDLEVDPQSQGFPLHWFDIIIAANVLHATRDLPQALQKINSLLGPGGMLLAFEVTEPLAWFDVTTALIEGWGRFEDSLRSSTPLLSAPQWMEALQATGFVGSASFPEAGTPASILGSHILMAHTSLGGAPNAIESFLVPQVVSGISSVPQRKEKEPDPQLEGLLSALPGERIELLIDYVRQQLAHILRLPNPEKLDRRQHLMDLGVDSLLALELKSRLQKGLRLEVTLPSTLIYDYPSIEAVAGYLETVLFGTSLHPSSTKDLASLELQETGTSGLEDLSELENLTEEQIEVLILKKLKNI